MKKLFLLLASGSIAFSSGAQQRMVNMVNSPIKMNVDVNQRLKDLNNKTRKQNVPGAASKTTADPRWYSYVNYFDVNETALSSSVDGALPYLWGNNDALMTYGDGAGGTSYDTVNFVSYGTVLDPSYGATYNGFNEYAYYPGETKITAADAYVIDSIQFSGAYVTDPAKVFHVDTLRVSVFYGTGAATSDIREGTQPVTAGGVLENYLPAGSTLKYQFMLYNAATRAAAGSTVYTTDLLLDNTTSPPSWMADTGANGLYIGTVLAGGSSMSIPAGNMVGVTVTFISGDPTFTPGDTVFFGSPRVPAVKYNMFRPLVIYRGSGATVSFPTYSELDRNTGSFLGDPADGGYSPNWFWSAGGGAATAQYPDIAVRVKDCATCGVVVEDPGPGGSVKAVSNITKVDAYPNPSTSELHIPFLLSNSANVTVTLSNTLGQVVASQDMGKVANGQAVFNTNSLASGIYTYTVIADGQRTTGRVAVAH